MKYRSPEFDHELKVHPPHHLTELTAIGFLLRITNPSARIIMNLVNFLQRIFSISSACLIAILSRIELTEGSIKTLSDSFRETVRGWSRTSGDVLVCQLLLLAGGRVNVGGIVVV